MAGYVYIESEPGFFTVGCYDARERWCPESDHRDRSEAAARVAYLNGGAPEPVAQKAAPDLTVPVTLDVRRLAATLRIIARVAEEIAGTLTDAVTDLRMLVAEEADPGHLEDAAAVQEAATGEPYDPWADAAQDPTTTPEG
jgi:hypothetical protein